MGVSDEVTDAALRRQAILYRERNKSGGIAIVLEFVR
jgi:hypothetical protein